MEKPLERSIHYDADRRLNIVRVHDGVGTIYVFNVPPDIKLEIKDVLERGQMISVKSKGQSCQRMDGTTDQYFRKYQLVVPLEPKDSDLSDEEFEHALAESRKNAPAYRDITRHPHYETPQLEAKPPKTEIIKGFNYTKFEKRGDEFFFLGNKIYKPEGRDCYVVRSTRVCQICREPVHLEATVSFREGKPWTVSSQKPTTKGNAEPVTKGSSLWKHTVCVPAIAPAAVKEPTLKKPAMKNPAEQKSKAAAAKILRLVGQPDEVIKSGFVTFKRKGESFYYKDALIQSKPSNWRGLNRTAHFVIYDMPCHECGMPLVFKTTVAYKNDRPESVGGATPLGVEAIPAKPKSRNWKHKTCPKQAAPQGEVEAEELPLQQQAEPAAEPERQAAAPEAEPAAEPERQAEPAAEHKEAEPAPPEHDLSPHERTVKIDIRLTKRLAEMALDSSLNSEIFRGATYMYLLDLLLDQGGE